MIKVYQIKDAFSTKSSIRFTVNGKSKTIIFESKRKNGFLLYETGDEDVQAAIEKSKYFKNKEITVAGKRNAPTPVEKDEEDFDENENKDNFNEDFVEYPEVTKFREAMEILTSEPYNLPKVGHGLNSKEAVKEKAAEFGVSFPNL